MAGRRERIDRKMGTEVELAVLGPSTDAIVVFRDGWGDVIRRYDLGSLGLPPDIAMLLAEAFRHHCPSSNDLRLFGLWKNGVSGSVSWLI